MWKTGDTWQDRVGIVIKFTEARFSDSLDGKVFLRSLLCPGFHRRRRPPRTDRHPWSSTGLY